MLGLQTNVFCDTGFILFSGFLKLDQFAVTFLYTFLHISFSVVDITRCSIALQNLRKNVHDNNLLVNSHQNKR